MKMTRRAFLGGTLALAASGCSHVRQSRRGILVNDVQSRLNETHVDRVVHVGSWEKLESVVKRAAETGEPLSVCGGRHAMGGQQFLSDRLLIGTTGMRRVLKFDRERGTIEVEAGIQWPELLRYLLPNQTDPEQTWTFAQKQTGANRFCLGGALGSNIHSRGLTMKPLISDIESFTMVDSTGRLRKCSRNENLDFFRLAIGGYGLFGVVYSVTLRLAPRRKLERVVELRNVDDVMPAFERRIDDGFLYGDFQFAIDPASDDFLRRGIFSCYRPVPLTTPILPRRRLSSQTWLNLVHGAHVQPTRAFEEYARYYQTTSGSIYWSDLHQFSGYRDDFHDVVDNRMKATHRGSEIITEIYVPRSRLVEFMEQARRHFRQNKIAVIYGTIRLIERDEESFLTWARERYACVIFNLHTVHTRVGIQQSGDAFRALIDLAAERGGTYYLTYHRFATRRQVETCYPEFPEFLRLKRKFDPQEIFQSDWYRHYREPD